MKFITRFWFGPLAEIFAAIAHQTLTPLGLHRQPILHVQTPMCFTQPRCRDDSTTHTTADICGAASAVLALHQIFSQLPGVLLCSGPGCHP